MKKIIIITTLCFLIASALLPSVTSSPAGININITNNSSNQNEPMVAINPLDHNKLVCGFNDNRNGPWSVGWSWSDDGGLTWIYGGDFSFSGYTCCADPVVAFDNMGTCYFAGLTYNPYGNYGQDGSIFIAKSNDGGHTFSVFEKIIVTGSGITPHLDKPWLYVNPSNNHIYLTWVERTNAWSGPASESATIWFTRSIDGGVTFSEPVQVSTFDPATGTSRSHGPQITAVSANHVYVSWHTVEEGNLPNPPTTPWKIWISESTDGGINFGTNYLVANSVWGYPNRFISMDADSSTGKVYIAYADSTVKYPRDYDIFITSSSSATGPWTAPEKVNDDPVGSGYWQSWPSLDVAPNGRVDVIWYDYRDNPNKMKVYYSSSMDEGATWETNLKITDLVSGSTPTPDDVFAGDYITVASVDEKAIAVWMDNRLGNPEIYTVAIARIPGVVLLFDTSGSMSWSHKGEQQVSQDKQRITLAKRAAIPFLQMLNDHYADQTYLGIVNFPWHPWSISLDCMGQIKTPLTLADSSIINTAISTIIPNLIANGNTPLLAGMSTALEMFETQSKKAIVLLSDGYHNCPSTVDPLDPQVTSLINQLKTEEINVYTIGFARPSDIDHPLLEALAQETNGLFYDVTVPQFNPDNWDPGLELQNTYKSILVDCLGLQPIVDPFGSIGAGDKIIHDININEHDLKVSFFLSWASTESGRLNLTIRSSDGQPILRTTNGVTRYEGETHIIVTVGGDVLNSPGRVGPKPWNIEIDGENLTGEEVKYQYSVIADSRLQMKPLIQVSSLETGAKITLSVEITETEIPVTDLTNVSVQVIRPSEGLGNWFVKNSITDEELNKIPEIIGNETLSVKYRKLLYLIDEKKIDLPSYITGGTIRLFDDGAHGDAKADDGIYTNTYTDTIKEGTYSFHFYANGSTLGGNIFERETEIQKYLTPKFSPEHSNVKIVSIYGDNKIQRIEIFVTPMDAIGNYLGPGYVDGITLNVPWGKAISELQDNLDGSYSLIYEIPTSVTSKAEITVELENKTKSVMWREAPGPELLNWLTWVLIILIILLLILIAVTRFRS